MRRPAGTASPSAPPGPSPVRARKRRAPSRTTACVRARGLHGRKTCGRRDRLLVAADGLDEVAEVIDHAVRFFEVGRPVEVDRGARLDGSRGAVRGARAARVELLVLEVEILAVHDADGALVAADLFA